MAKARAFTFTLNNPTDEDEVRLLDADTKYLIYGRELAPTTGTPHLQGYIVFRNARYLKPVKAIIGKRAHIEVAKGSAEQNIVYCKKDGDWNEKGEAPLTQAEKGAAEQARWDDVWEKAKLGAIEEIDPKIRIQCYSTIRRIQKDYMAAVPDHDGVTGVWIVGPSGCGKSRKAREDYPGAYLKLANKWWDGYQGEESVIIDDLDPKHECLAYHLKIWADRYAFNAEVKGGMMRVRPTAVVVTSQYEIERIWPDAETQEALKRRFTIIRMGAFPPAIHPFFHQ